MLHALESAEVGIGVTDEPEISPVSSGETADISLGEPAVPQAVPGAMTAQPLTTGIGHAVSDMLRPAGWKRDAVRRDNRLPPHAGLPSPFARDLSIRRYLFLVLLLATAAIGVAHLASVLNIDGFTLLEMGMLGVFAVLFAWISAGFWLVCFGYVARSWRIPLDALRSDGRRRAQPMNVPARTALVMPIYNENPARVFAGLTSICQSLRAAGGLAAFDLYVLSDSDEADTCAAEVHLWLRMRRSFGNDARIYYRNRPDNVGRKSGNIADFCRNWGRRYEHMVVLDADSLMTGETLLELVALMDANPDTALIQVPPQLVGRESLFARMQQFASSVYGPLVASGMAALSGPDGNYWGHNAIIRVAPFMACCGLPKLSGKPPFGGEILSHDFVEAALLHRAGWQVWLVPELGGSYEESPPTLVDHLERDRRWCQGNLQHARLLLTRGLRLPSCLNFVVGIMSYLSSPLWLLMLAMTSVEAYLLAEAQQIGYRGTAPVLIWHLSRAKELILLISITALLLFGPKLLAFLDLRRDAERLAEHGGGVRAFGSIVLETLTSALAAPISMITHARFVIEILCGRCASWSGQQRDDRLISLCDVARIFAPHTLAAAAAAGLFFVILPERALWILPILVGLIAAIPLVSLTSSAHAGRLARHCGLFLTPPETAGLPVLGRVDESRSSDGNRHGGRTRRIAWRTAWPDGGKAVVPAWI